MRVSDPLELELQWFNLSDVGAGNGFWVLGKNSLFLNCQVFSSVCDF